MCDAIGHPVLSLKRKSIGSLTLGELPEGQWRHLTADELIRLNH
jgi:23S rRNA pseudouridine2605 synthase